VHKNNVIYILGHGRSGSTLLDIVLSSSNGNVSLGQFNGLEKSFQMDGCHCGCGEKIRNCRRWKHAFEYLDSMDDGTRSKLFSSAYFEKGKRFKQMINSMFYKETREGNVCTISVRAHDKLLSTIADGDGWLVDSSKNVNRLIALLQSNTVDVVTVFLVRDVISVARSKGKVKSERRSGMLVSSLSWAFQNLISAVLYQRIRSAKICLYYDGLVSNPNATLDSIFKLAGIASKCEIIFPIKMESVHMISGNSIKNTQSIELVSVDSKDIYGLKDHAIDWCVGKPTMYMVRKLVGKKSSKVSIY